jgi:hypothetical protein
MIFGISGIIAARLRGRCSLHYQSSPEKTAGWRASRPSYCRPHEFPIAGAKPIFGEARAMQQRQIFGCEITLVDLQLADDGSQFGVARFESYRAGGKISRWSWT